MEQSLIQIDFWSDYIRSIKQHLLNAGMSLDGTELDEKIFIACFNRVARELPPRPRQVHTPANFSVPPRHQGVIEDIQHEISSGADLSPRLSKRLKDWAYVDKMLADFGIHHFHLGSKIEADGFVTRGGALLYARFDADNAYLLAVRDHNEWTNTSLIEVIHSNWPATIAHLKIPALGLRFKISDDDRQELRTANINAPIELSDGTIYVSPGGGLSSDGTPTMISLMMTNARRTLRQSEKRAREVMTARLAKSPVSAPVTVKLHLRGGEGYAVEPVTGLEERLW